MKSAGMMLLSGLLLPSLFTLGSCSDAWNEHYDQTTANGTESLLELVESNPQLSDFLEVIKATHIYNNNHTTPVTYADLLDADQALTVWAPVNGTFNKDSLLDLCTTQKGDSTVGQHFVANHIAHNLYNMNTNTSEIVKMFNNKTLHLNPSALHNSKVIDGKYNLPATNGLLHVMNDDAPYIYNIYEGLTSMDEFSHLGSFLTHFERERLDEEHSIQSDVIDGQKIYSDSVMIKENALFRVLDYINSEDSTFLMLVPDKQTWEGVYNVAKKYYNFAPIEKGDSISEYWTNVALTRDLIYNRNRQRSEQDSIFSTSFSRMEYPYHVYYNPHEKGGLLDPANIKDSLLCSNGYIYRINEWPFTTKDLYFHHVVAEGEREAGIVDRKDCTINYRSVNDDNISGHGYADIVPAKSTSNWTVTYEIKNTLSGTYDIMAVILPKTVYMENSRDTKKNKFKATLTYMDAEGNTQQQAFNTEVTNNGETTDSVLIGRFTFPVCNYQQPESTVRLQLQCSITSKQTSYSREMFLDCIYLKPITDEDILAEEQEKENAAAKSRKEVRK